MTKNILSMNDFKGKKSIKEPVVNEMVEAIDDFYRVSVDVDLPKALVSSFIKKVKESTGKDLRADMGEKRLAERLVQWANENYLNIENLPVEIVTGVDKSPVQAQAQTQVQFDDEDKDDLGQGQAQVQAQGQAQVQAQGQAQVQGQGQVQGQAQPQVQVHSQGQGQVQAQGQVQKAQSAAAQIPAQEI